MTHLDDLRKDGYIRPPQPHEAQPTWEGISAWGTKPMARCCEPECGAIAFRSGRCKMHYDAHQRKLVRARKQRRKAG